MLTIDLNCDCGESFGPWVMGEDDSLLPHVTSANIACGGHAGDPLVMRRTLRRCKELGLAVGAHPGYADLQGFGRRHMAMAPAEIEALVLAQIGALAALARAEGLELRHVKAHGALYNDAAASPPVAEALAAGVAAFSRELVLVGLAGSAQIAAGQAAGLHVSREAFADRAYEPDGSLRRRGLPGALILDPAANLAQALSIISRGFAIAADGIQVPVWADTLCVHGDTPGAAARAAALRQGLAAAGVEVRPR
jgi:UPF0271 protein